ncbi:MAG: hypothetical protein ACMXYE_04315 [Candidatus Woesearchaeota archaeon]
MKQKKEQIVKRFKIVMPIFLILSIFVFFFVDTVIGTVLLVPSILLLLIGGIFYAKDKELNTFDKINLRTNLILGSILVFVGIGWISSSLLFNQNISTTDLLLGLLQIGLGIYLISTELKNKK